MYMGHIHTLTKTYTLKILSRVFADDKQSDVSVDLGQMDEDSKAADLLSDVVALGGRLAPEALAHCSPNQLGLMHEHLSGMMRNIVTQLQSRLLSNLDDSLP